MTDLIETWKTMRHKDDEIAELNERIAELEALVEELKEIIKIYEQNSEENLKQAKGEN